jgi:hypothetical protein
MFHFIYYYLLFFILFGLQIPPTAHQLSPLCIAYPKGRRYCQNMCMQFLHTAEPCD